MSSYQASYIDALAAAVVAKGGTVPAVATPSSLERRSLQLYAALATAAGAGSVPLAQNYSAQVLNTLAAAIVARAGTLPPPESNYCAALLAHLEVLVLAWGGDISGLPANFYGRSLGLLGRLAVAYDADAQAWFTAVEATGATFGPNAGAISTNKSAFSTFWTGCKTDGIDAAIQQLIFLRGVSTLAGTLVPFKGPAPTNILLVQGSLNPATGMIGNGINQTLNLNVNNSSTPQNDNHNAVYVHTASSGGCYLGNTAVAGGNVIVPFNGDLFLRSRVGAGGQLVGDANATGFIGFSRSDSANLNIRVNSTNSTIAQVSQAPAGGNLHTHSRGDGTSFSTVRESAISNGTNLNLALLDARMTTLFNTLVWT